jgi:hypothetical protein
MLYEVFLGLKLYGWRMGLLGVRPLFSLLDVVKDLVKGLKGSSAPLFV